MRKFYTWYVPRLGLEAGAARQLQQALQGTNSLAQARALLVGAQSRLPAAA